MRKITIAFLVLFGMGFAAGVARAGTFKLIDINHPAVVTGVFSDLRGHSDAGISLAIVTHTGIPNFVPVAIGGSLGHSLGGPSLAIGMSLNLLPDVKAGILEIINAVYSDPAKFQNLKGILAPPVSGTPDFSISCGSHWSYVLDNGIHGRGMLTLFYGAKWVF